MKKLEFVKKKDIIIIGALLLIALVVFLVSLTLRNKGSVHAEIMLGSTVILNVELNKAGTIAVPGRPNVKLEIKDGAIGFIHSDCPDQVCVHTGFLKSAGDFAACLPNNVLLFIKGDNGADTVTK